MDIPRTVNVLGIPYQVEFGGCEPDENGFCSPTNQLAREEYEDEQLVQGLAIGLHQALFTN